ncbi:MAG: hypothetical protein R3C11_03860 [Planctomycetaceae bacterium]
MRFTILIILLLFAVAGCQKKSEVETKTPPTDSSKQTRQAAPSPEISKGEEIALILLNDEIEEQERRDLFPEHPQLAAEIVTAMTKEAPFDEEEEYRRIPWIWRVSINATKTLNKDEIRELLEVSLPEVGKPLADWQAVVIGGGVINGLTLKGEWPREYLKPIVEQETDLLERWNYMLEASLKMAHDSTVRTGTRYDALRNLGMLSWKEAGADLTEYLAANANSELKQGAICGLADMHSSAADSLLLAGWLNYDSHLKYFAFEGMLRTPDRFRLLKQEISAGRIDPTFLTEEDREKLLNHPHELTKQHASELLAKPVEPAVPAADHDHSEHSEGSDPQK